MIETIKVSSKGQIVIPEGVRKRLHIDEGTKLVLIEKENRLILETEADFAKHLAAIDELREKKGWLMMSEENLRKVWNNPQDDAAWGKYL